MSFITRLNIKEINKIAINEGINISEASEIEVGFSFSEGNKIISLFIFSSFRFKV